ncbi:VOC family protein [Saccharospirillum mangrovi]|uniref:VOC family protein n=1 Tax=Saccharospirillum mangrovi TaxID=2161747 RepID=UPI000D347526|nr:VOC family protein [Saccharospirillum mangrovi]
MNPMIFVNLPVVNLDAAKTFYSQLGFTNNPNFSDDTAACMVLSDTIYVMLLTHAKWETFTKRPIPSIEAGEVMLALTYESRDAVNEVVDAAGRAKGVADINPAQDHGFMYSRSFLDLDGHLWEAVWMDPAAVSG